MIYEQEVKRLAELKNEKEHLNKNVEFYKKIDEDIKEKERKLEENIKSCAEDSEFSKKRA